MSNRWLYTDGNTMSSKISLGCTDAECSEVKDRSGKHRRGMAVANPFDEMLERADPAGGDDRHPHRIGDRPGQFDVEAGLGAVAVHRGQQDLAGPMIGQATGPFDGVDAGRPPPPMSEHFPFLRF